MISLLEQIRRSDNLRPVRDQKTASAALALHEGIERGTAIIPVPDGDGIARPEGTGALYRPLAGDGFYEAEIVAKAANGERVTLDVIIPGCQDRVRLSDVRWLPWPWPQGES